MRGRLQRGKCGVLSSNRRNPGCWQRSHGGGGVAGGVARDFLNVHGHFLTGACARPPFRGDFPAVTGDFLTVNPDFLTVNPDFPAARGGRSNVAAGGAVVGGDCTVADGG